MGRTRGAPSLLLAALLAAPGTASPAGGGWRRHTVDASSRGADGVRLLDVNGDGLADVATPWEEGGAVRVCLNPGPERSALPWPAVTAARVGAPEDAVLADLDGDSAADVVTCCEGGVRSAFVSWAPPSAEEYLDPSAWRTEPFPAVAGKGQWMFCLPLQIDGRAGIDLVIGGKGDGARVGWLSCPSEARALDGWTWRQLCEAGWIMSLLARDMDGDGDRDVLLSDRKGANRGVTWLENPGPGAAQSRPWPRHVVGGRGKEVMFLTAADIDGDGLEDVLAAVAGKELLCSRRVASSPPAWEHLSIALPAGCGTGKAVAVGDIDLDGAADIAFTCEHARGASGVMWLARRGAPGTPLAGSRWEAHDISGDAEGAKYDLVELLDIDGDGDLDALTCEEQDNLGVVWYENPARAPLRVKER